MLTFVNNTESNTISTKFTKGNPQNSSQYDIYHYLSTNFFSLEPFFGSAIRISRKGWHMLLNFCFHTALTFAVFAGGINRIKYPIICQAVSAFPFHSSHSQSFSKNWLWMSIQVSTTRPLGAVCGCTITPLCVSFMLQLHVWSGHSFSKVVA